MGFDLSGAEWAEIVAFAVLLGAAATAIWISWRRIARLGAAKLELEERLRLAKDSGKQLVEKLTITQARFQDLHGRIKASESFVSLAQSAGVVARSIADLGKIHDQMTATLSAE
jgi:hypothetical protein